MAVIIIEGPPGTGKTLALMDALVARAKNPERTGMVYANMVGLKCPEAIYCEAVDDFADLSRGEVALDEGGLFFGSRTWQERSKEIMAAFAQVRKDGLDLLITAQHRDRLDTILRENCTEIWTMSRLGPFFCVTRTDPHVTDKKAKILGRRYFLLKMPVAACYDTYEKIDSLGRGGGGANIAPALSVVARRREAARTITEQQATRRKLLRETVFQPGRGNMQLTEEALEAQRYLERLRWELFRDDSPVKAGTVQREVARRRWLKVWGRTWADVPYDCTFSNPWLADHDPRTVSLRNVERRKHEEIVKAMADQALKELKKAASLSMRR